MHIFLLNFNDYSQANGNSIILAKTINNVFDVFIK